MKTELDMKKLVAIVTLLICIVFICLALYAYFILKKASLQNLIMVVLFFGTGIVVEIITLISKHEDWFAKRQHLTRSQLIIMGICSLVIAFCSLSAGFIQLNIYLKIILFTSFLFFGMGSLTLFRKSKTNG
jgi:hypothetical protein